MNSGDYSQYFAATLIGLLSLGSFGALFIWSVLKGQFKNIEKPKMRLLELENETGVKL